MWTNSIFPVFDDLNLIDPLFARNDSKLLQEKINQKKFKGEKGKILNFDFFDQRLQSLKIIGLGESKNINSNDVKRTNLLPSEEDTINTI